MFSRGGGSRRTLCSPRPLWRSSWCWHHCSQESLEPIEINKSCLFVKMQKHNILICLDHVAVWITYRPLKKHMHSVKVKSSGGLSVGMWGNPATHASLLFSRCSRGKKARDCYQLSFCVVTYVFATESSGSCSWRKHQCRMCLWAAPRKNPQTGNWLDKKQRHQEQTKQRRQFKGREVSSGHKFNQ